MLEALKRELAASKQELQVLQGTLETSIQVRARLRPHCQHPAAVSEPSPRPLLRLRWDSWHSSSPKLRGRFPFSCLSALARQGIAQQVALGVTNSIAPLSVPDGGGFHDHIMRFTPMGVRLYPHSLLQQGLMGQRGQDPRARHLPAACLGASRQPSSPCLVTTDRLTVWLCPLQSSCRQYALMSQPLHALPC